MRRPWGFPGAAKPASAAFKASKKLFQRFQSAPGAPRSTSERSPALENTAFGAPGAFKTYGNTSFGDPGAFLERPYPPPQPSGLPRSSSGLPRSSSSASKVRQARPGARPNAPRRSKALPLGPPWSAGTRLRGHPGFQRVLTAPSGRVRQALRSAQHAPSLLPSRLFASARSRCVARGRHARPLALPLPPREACAESPRAFRSLQRG